MGPLWYELGTPLVLFGRPWGDLGASLGRFGADLRRLGADLGRLGAVLGRLGAVLGRLGAVLERCCIAKARQNQKTSKTLGISMVFEVQGGASWAPFGAILGHPWCFLGSLGAILGRPWAVLGRTWGVLGRTWGVLGRCWDVLGRSWGVLGRSWEHVALQRRVRTKNHQKPCVFTWFLKPRVGHLGPPLVRAWDTLGAF